MPSPNWPDECPLDGPLAKLDGPPFERGYYAAIQDWQTETVFPIGFQSQAKAEATLIETNRRWTDYSKLLDLARLALGFTVDFRQTQTDWKNHPEVGKLYAILSGGLSALGENDNKHVNIWAIIPAADRLATALTLYLSVKHNHGHNSDKAREAETALLDAAQAYEKAAR